MTDLQYPVGKLQLKPSPTSDERLDLIQQIAEAPVHLRKAVAGLSAEQLDTPYRPGGWTVRQVAHHLPDSHLNAYVRMKLALTESQPTIKPYNEKLWAELHDVKTAPVETSLTLLESLHERWVLLLRSLAPEDFLKTMLHPENGVINLDFIVQMYSWHGRHHVAHITALRQRMGWK
ncbi:MAG: putative metal-dependent hydrolase [Bacteroidetes bacterium]|nr:putative metal-dependent hydrolase [Bacteroidota bacterium]